MMTIKTAQFFDEEQMMGALAPETKVYFRVLHQIENSLYHLHGNSLTDQATEKAKADVRNAIASLRTKALGEQSPPDTGMVA